MTKIVILGSGVMGSALAIPAADKPGNSVTLVGSPLDDELVDSVQSTGMHPTLRVRIPDTIQTIKLAELDSELLASANVIVLGVSSPGVEWATQLISHCRASPDILALVTKGLVENTATRLPPLTYADSMKQSLPDIADRLVGIGGPCIARELALQFPTRVTFASRDISHASQLRDLLQTDYYRITTHQNIVAVEACAALKNFLCIGVSAMLGAYPQDDTHAKNPVAALFNQAVLELLILSRWISSSEPASSAEPDVAFDLAGMGDLHVTVGGGRNSRLGHYLGQGRRVNDLVRNDMAGITVEGVDTGRRLAPALSEACRSGTLDRQALPLTWAIINSIENDDLFAFDFGLLPG